VFAATLLACWLAYGECVALRHLAPSEPAARAWIESKYRELMRDGVDLGEGTIVFVPTEEV